MKARSISTCLFGFFFLENKKARIFKIGYFLPELHDYIVQLFTFKQQFCKSSLANQEE